MSNTDPVAAAMAAAQAAAAAAVAAASTPAPASPQVPAIASSANQVPAVAPQVLSMESMAQGSMSVDAWFKVKEDGLKIGDMAGLLDEVEAVLNMTAGSGFVLKYAVKNGNPAQYAYTTDLATAFGGGTWAAAMQRIQALNPATPVAPYRCVDLPFKLINPVSKGGVVLAKAGDTIGYTTSTTNWKNWEDFYKECVKAGLLGKDVLVKLTAQARSNKAGNTWGVLKLELVGEYIPDENE